MEQGAADQALDARDGADRLEERVGRGLAELDRWLENRVRIGFGKSFDDAEAAAFIADRLEAAHLPRLAARIEESERFRRAGETRRRLAEYGALHLFATSWPRRATLPGPLYATLRCRLGLPVDLAAQPVEDLWQVVAAEAYGPTWVRGVGTGRYARLEHRSGADPGLAPGRPPAAAGALFEAPLRFHAEAVPLCAVTHGTVVAEPGREVPPGADFETLLEQFRAATAADPWTDRFPACVAHAAVVRLEDEGWLIADGRGDAVPLLARSQATAVSTLWRLAAFSAQAGAAGDGALPKGHVRVEADTGDARGEDLTVFGFLAAEGFIAVTAWARGLVIRL